MNGQLRQHSPIPSEYRLVGRNLFGRPLKLFVAHWILSQRGRQFFQMELIIACGRHSTNALKPLSELIELGMVAELPSHVSGQRRKYYQQTGSGLWDAVVAAVGAAGEDPHREPQVGLL